MKRSYLSGVCDRIASLEKEGTVAAVLKNAAERKTVLKICAVAAAAAILLMLKPFLSKDSSADSALKSGTAEVCFVDTGQSDCILIRTEEAAVLIDAGEVGCEGAVCSALEKRGISVLSLVVATHPHSDHIGSMEAVFDEFSVERLLVPDIPEEYLLDSPLYDGVLSTAENKDGCAVIYAEPGMKFDLGGGAVLEVLGPVECYFDEINNWSVVTKFTFGETSFLFTGDAEAAAELDLIAYSTDLSCDVLKCGHHGSRTSTTEELLDAAAPQYAVFLCGEGNVHGHPHQSTKEALYRRGIRMLRTDLDGTVTMTTDGKNIFIETEK